MRERLLLRHLIAGSAIDVLVPAWTSYDREARRMIAAVRAMGLLE